MTEAIQLLVVDDHTLFRRGLIALLSQDERFQIVGEAGDVGEALRVLAKVQPEAVLVLGDTNSCLSVIPAKRRKVPIFHMEAGNRCFDQDRKSVV